MADGGLVLGVFRPKHLSGRLLVHGVWTTDAVAAHEGASVRAVSGGAPLGTFRVAGYLKPSAPSSQPSLILAPVDGSVDLGGGEVLVFGEGVCRTYDLPLSDLALEEALTDEVVSGHVWMTQPGTEAKEMFPAVIAKTTEARASVHVFFDSQEAEPAAHATRRTIDCWTPATQAA